MPRVLSLRRKLEIVCLFLAMLTTTPTPFENHDVQEELLRLLLPGLLLLATMLAPPRTGEALPIMYRLDPTFRGFRFTGRDFFSTIESQRYLFWLNTGELPETLAELVEDVSRDLSQRNRNGHPRQRRRRSKLNFTNQVLLTIMWLRKYHCLSTLALIFDVSPSTVSATIHLVIPVLWRYFQNPTMGEWNALRGNWRSFPNAVGCIDGTPHEIYRPEAEPQAEFYSGHRHYHLLNTQLIVDNLGNIVFLQAGFLGAMNDAGNFNLMERIGPGTRYDMPGNLVLLADKGYADVPPLLTPFRAAQIRRLGRLDRQRARRFNRRLSKCRVIIEHTIKYMKSYRAVGSIWRHPRWFQPVVVELCTFLAQRHVVLFEELSD